MELLVCIKRRWSGADKRRKMTHERQALYFNQLKDVAVVAFLPRTQLFCKTIVAKESILGNVFIAVS